jgi:transposase
VKKAAPGSPQPGSAGTATGQAQPAVWTASAVMMAAIVVAAVWDSRSREIVKRPDDLHVFKVLPRRWVVERSLSWITRHRRTVRDYERLPARHETYVYWAMIIVMTRRLARHQAAAEPGAT